MVVEVGLLQLLWGIRSIVGSFVWYQVREPSGLKDVIHSGFYSHSMLRGSQAVRLFSWHFHNICRFRSLLLLAVAE